MVVGIDRDTPGPDPNTPLLSPDQRCMLDALGDQAAVSIERIALAEDIDRSRLFSETERLRAAMQDSDAVVVAPFARPVTGSTAFPASGNGRPR